ncbi:MAG: holin [Lawsonibacter sp.]|nr:holin [Lawsonibacter sp.]
MTDLTPVINAFIALVAALITAFVIPWIKRNTSAKDREELLKWVEIAVMAAQQLYQQLDGSKRKEYVLNFLREKGYDVTSAEVDNAIEAAVLKLHQELEAAG